MGIIFFDFACLSLKFSERHAKFSNSVKNQPNLTDYDFHFMTCLENRVSIPKIYLL